MMYHARDLAAMSKDELWSLPDGPVKVVFDDGVVDSTMRATRYSTYIWAYYVHFPKTPALRAHHLSSTRIRSDTHMKLLEKVMWDCYDAYQGEVHQEVLSRLAYEITNQIYNDFTYRCEEYVTTLSILDFVEVLEHPEIAAANEAVEPNRLSIDKTHARVKSVLLDPRELVDNPIALLAKNELVSMGQILQCVSARGYLTDVDSTLFPYPILTGFAMGLSTLYDKMIESRSAAKALTFTEKPLQETEYFNRRLQLMAATLSRIVPGDCGSQQYLDWHVEGNDLAVLAGKYYLTDQGLRRLEKTDTHLRGEILKLRSIFYCQLENTNHVCETCFGALAKNIPANTNIGHVSATALCEQVSQKVLSVKHEDTNSASDVIELSEVDQLYIRAINDPPSIKLADRMQHKRVFLTVQAREAQQLPSVEYTDDVRVLKITNISELTTVELTIQGKNGEDRVVVPVSAGTRRSSMSHELLAYVKEKRWTVDVNGNYRIDLCDWDVEQPLFILPLKHTNMLDYMKTIESFLKASKTSKEGKRSLLDHADPASALREFNQLVASQLKVNIAHLEVLVRVTMIASSKHRDYRIPRPGNKVEWGAFQEIMACRSMGPAMAHEKHKHVLNDPNTYLIKTRPPHILDPILLPPKDPPVEPGSAL